MPLQNQRTRIGIQNIIEKEPHIQQIVPRGTQLTLELETQTLTLMQINALRTVERKL